MGRAPLRNTPLLDRLRRYPGGLQALADASGVALPSLYRLAAGEHRLPPYRLLERVAPTLGVSVDALVRLWRRSRPAVPQKGT